MAGPIVPVMAVFAGPMREIAAASIKDGSTVVSIAMMKISQKAGMGMIRVAGLSTLKK